MPDALRCVSQRTPRLRRDPTKWSRRIRKNGEADNVQTDSLHSASRASRKAPHPLLRFSSQNRNDVSVLKGRAAKRTSPRVYTGAASEAARCAPFPRQARKLRICSRLLPDPPESLRWIPSEMRGRERARSDAAKTPHPVWVRRLRAGEKRRNEDGEKNERQSSLETCFRRRMAGEVAAEGGEPPPRCWEWTVPRLSGVSF